MLQFSIINSTFTKQDQSENIGFIFHSTIIYIKLFN